MLTQTRQMDQAKVSYKTIIELPAAAIRDCQCVMPSADKLLDPLNPVNAGLVRHGGVGQPANHVPQHYKHNYITHLRKYLEGTIVDEKRRRAYLLLGARNSFQNLMLPLWLNGHLIRRRDEPWQTTIYVALCRLSSGSLMIQKLRFKTKDGIPSIVGENEEPIDWAVAGQPLLFNADVPPISLLAAMTYDLRHIFHLLWEDWQLERFPEFGFHRQAHDELMAAFMDNLSLDVGVRAAALSEVAVRRSLQLEEGYLHSSLGLRSDGSVISVMMTGSLHDHARVHKEYGAKSAILLDNGGSVGAAYWSEKSCRDNAFRQEPLMPVLFGNSSYFRNSALTTVLFELNEDILEEPFRPRARGDEAFTEW